jgi:hypothetical protein
LQLSKYAIGQLDGSAGGKSLSDPVGRSMHPLHTRTQRQRPRPPSPRRRRPDSSASSIFFPLFLHAGLAWRICMSDRSGFRWPRGDGTGETTSSSPEEHPPSHRRGRRRGSCCSSARFFRGAGSERPAFDAVLSLLSLSLPSHTLRLSFPSPAFTSSPLRQLQRCSPPSSSPSSP